MKLWYKTMGSSKQWANSEDTHDHWPLTVPNNAVVCYCSSCVNGWCL